MRKQLPASSFQLPGTSRGLLHFLKAESWQLAAAAPAGRRGFTLIELLVVIAIIIFLAAMILANTNRFGGQTLVQNLAYDMALSIRQAQVYGISVTNYGSGCSSFECGYGVHFGMSTNTTYNLFADVAQTGIYKAGEDVSPSPYTLNQNYAVAELCYTSSNKESCSTAGGTTLDILFLRPDPDACISWGGVSQVSIASGIEQCSASDPYQSARVVVVSPNGDYESVVVSANGYISVLQKGL